MDFLDNYMLGIIGGKLLCFKGRWLYRRIYESIKYDPKLNNLRMNLFSPLCSVVYLEGGKGLTAKEGLNRLGTGDDCFHRRLGRPNSM